jgi:8-oxo-dGTP diphosphatase
MKDFVLLSPPKDFHPHVEVAGSYCEYDDKILFLKRSPHKPHGMAWNIPGGKLDAGETPRAAAVRELFEEVGISLQEHDLEDVNKFYIRATEINYIFYTFRAHFLTRPVIKLNLEEHVEAGWFTADEILTLPLIYGGAEVFQGYKKFKGCVM